MKTNKIVLLVVFVVIFMAGVAVIISNSSVSFDEMLRSMGRLNPRILSLMALPFVVILVVLGLYLRRRNEERKWKQALMKTRAKRQS